MACGMLAGTTRFAFLSVTLNAETGLFRTYMDTMQSNVLVGEDEVVGFSNVTWHGH